MNSKEKLEGESFDFTFWASNLRERERRREQDEGVPRKRDTVSPVAGLAVNFLESIFEIAFGVASREREESESRFRVCESLGGFCFYCSLFFLSLLLIYN